MGLIQIVNAEGKQQITVKVLDAWEELWFSWVNGERKTHKTDSTVQKL